MKLNPEQKQNYQCWFPENVYVIYYFFIKTITEKQLFEVL